MTPGFSAIYRDEEKIGRRSWLGEKITDMSADTQAGTWRKQSEAAWESRAGCVHLGASLMKMPFIAVGLDEITKGLN